MNNEKNDHDDFEITSTNTKALLKPCETILLSYYEDLARSDVVNKYYPRSEATISPVGYEYPTWSSYTDAESSFHDQDSICCNACAKILTSKQPVISCDVCSQMTYCSNDCKDDHRANGHTPSFCEIMRRMDSNSVTKGELLTLLEEIPKEEDYDGPMFTKGGTITSTMEIGETVRNARKEERRFVNKSNVDFEKLVHEIVRVECATCGGGSGNKYASDDKDQNRNLQSSSSSYSRDGDDEYDENEEETEETTESEYKDKNKKYHTESTVSDRIFECNSYSPSSSVFPRFEKLAPLDKKMVFITNSYLNSLGYDNMVDMELFDNLKISKSLFDFYDASTSQKDQKEEEVDPHVGAFINLGLGFVRYPYRHRRRRFYRGPSYYGRPYGWRYGRRYNPRIGYYGYHNDPRLGYYGGTYGGRLGVGIGENAMMSFFSIEKNYDSSEIESSLLIRGKASEIALKYLKKVKSGGSATLASLTKHQKHSQSHRSDSPPAVAFSVAIVPIHLKEGKKGSETQNSLDVENVPTKATSLAFVNKVTKVKGTQMLPVGKYSIERMMGLHALVLKTFDFYRRNTSKNILELPFDRHSGVWSNYNNFSLSFLVNNDGTGAKKTNVSGHFPLDFTYFDRPYYTGKTKIVRSKYGGYSQVQSLILSYLTQSGFVSLPSVDPSRVSYKQLSKLPFKRCFIGRVDPNVVFATKPKKWESLLTYEDILKPASSSTKQGHFKLSISNNHTSVHYVHSEGADIELKPIQEILTRSIFVFDTALVPEAQEDMPPSFRDDTYVGITNAQIKMAAEKSNLPIMVVAHEVHDPTEEVTKKDTLGLVFMFFEWVRPETPAGQSSRGHHILSQIIYLAHDKNMAYNYFSPSPSLSS